MASSLGGARDFRCRTGLTHDGHSSTLRFAMLAQSVMRASPLRATPRSSSAQLRPGTDQPASQGCRSGARQRHCAENKTAISAASQSAGSSSVGVGVFPAGAPLPMHTSELRPAWTLRLPRYISTVAERSLGGGPGASALMHSSSVKPAPTGSVSRGSAACHWHLELCIACLIARTEIVAPRAASQARGRAKCGCQRCGCKWKRPSGLGTMAWQTLSSR